MLNILIYRKFEFVSSFYFVKGPSPDKVFLGRCSPIFLKERIIKIIMKKLYIFDMGGVLCCDFNDIPVISDYLGITEEIFSFIPVKILGNFLTEKLIVMNFG